MKKRLIAFSLSALMISSAVLMLSSCADSQNAGNTSKPAQSGDPNQTGDDMNKSGVPEGLNFATEDGNLPIHFVVGEADNDGFHKRSIKLDADELDEANKVDVAIRNRNALVEDALGVEIDLYEYIENDGIQASMIYTSIAAQSPEFDIFAGLQWNDIDMCLDGVLTDLNSLTDDSGNKVNFLSLDKPWWSGYYNDALRLGSANALYWVTGDLCLRYTGGYYCFFVNETLYEKDLLNVKSDLLSRKYGEDTNYGHIYDLVNHGDWTLDVLSEMVAKAYHDDGDDKVNRTDVLGLALPIWDNTNGLSIAAGVEYSHKTDQGVSLLFNSSNQTLIDFMTKMSTLLKSGYVYNYGGDYQGAFTDFSAGLSCFVSGRLNQAELYLQDMLDNYHIIPSPKMNFDQKEYRSSVHDAINLYGISYYSENKVAAMATLEEMAYRSYVNVRPIYYDQALKSLYTSDPGAASMIDLMHDVVYSDFVYIWQFSDYLGNKGGHGGLGDFLRNTAASSKPSSQLKKQQERWSNGLDELLEEIQKLEKEES